MQLPNLYLVTGPHDRQYVVMGFDEDDAISQVVYEHHNESPSRLVAVKQPDVIIIK